MDDRTHKFACHQHTHVDEVDVVVQVAAGQQCTARTE